MSDRNRNEFDFDDDDFFGRDDEPPLRDDEEFPTDFGSDIEGDMPVIEDQQEGRGGNRTFIILAAVMIALFLCGLAVILFLAFQPRENPAELTRVAIEATNNQIATFAAETSTANAIIQTETADALLIAQAATETAAAYTDTPSPTPSTTPSPTADQTSLAATANVAATQTAIALAGQAAAQTATAIAQQTISAGAATNTNTPVPPATSTPGDLGLSAVNQTATRIASDFLTATAAAAGVGGGEVTPTQEQPGFTPIPRATALPDTGLFDDIAGGGGIGLLALAVVGLVGVIAISRRLRASNDEPVDEAAKQ